MVGDGKWEGEEDGTGVESGKETGTGVLVEDITEAQADSGSGAGAWSWSDGIMPFEDGSLDSVLALSVPGSKVSH